MEKMPYHKEFEKCYREINPDVNCGIFTKGETGFYASEHTRNEYKWFCRGYRSAAMTDKEI